MSQICGEHTYFIQFAAVAVIIIVAAVIVIAAVIAIAAVVDSVGHTAAGIAVGSLADAGTAAAVDIAPVANTANTAASCLCRFCRFCCS